MVDVGIRIIFMHVIAEYSHEKLRLCSVEQILSMKCFEQSSGLDTALYKNLPSLTFGNVEESTHLLVARLMIHKIVTKQNE